MQRESKNPPQSFESSKIINNINKSTGTKSHPAAVSLDGKKQLADGSSYT